MTSSKTYCIKSSYRHRKQHLYFDDTQNNDEWQLEVYLYAQQLMKQNNFRSIIDIGCSSAYKLVNFLGQYDTLGLDVSPTYEWLLEKYPERRWMKLDFNIAERLA